MVKARGTHKGDEAPREQGYRYACTPPRLGTMEDTVFRKPERE